MAKKYKSNKFSQVNKQELSVPVGRLTSVSAHLRRKPKKRPKRIRHPRPDGSPRVVNVKAHRRHIGPQSEMVEQKHWEKAQGTARAKTPKVRLASQADAPVAAVAKAAKPKKPKAAAKPKKPKKPKKAKAGIELPTLFG